MLKCKVAHLLGERDFTHSLQFFEGQLYNGPIYCNLFRDTKNTLHDWRLNTMKKRTLALMLSAALCVGMLAGCGGGDAGSANSPAGNTNSPAVTESETPDNTTELTGTVVTNGSTSMESVMGSLTEAFREVQPGIQVQYTGSGSGAGITSAQDGTADIGLASRDLKDDETGVKAITVAKDGIAIIVNPENPVADLSVEQIAQLATGEITNWSEVGGNDAQVVFIGREAGSGTRDGFESITGTTDNCKYQNELTSTGEVIANVASNPNAIGYASLSAVDDTVKAITVGGVAPSEETVLDGSYAIQRNFNFIVSDSAELSDAAQAFIEWATSADAADLIAGAGAVPVAE